jgi:oligoendopeptidase F
MIIAETASILGELLLTDLLLGQSKSVREKKAILCRVLDESSLVFRVMVAARANLSFFLRGVL